MWRSQKIPKDQVLNMFLALQEFEDVFKEIPRLPPRRDIYFSIDLVPRATPVSKTLYRMNTP
jgi:hypothetical protein